MTTNKITEARLAEINGRVDAATEGPWHSGHTQDGVYSDAKYIADARELPDEFLIANAPTDLADLIAFAREAIRALRIHAPTCMSCNKIITSYDTKKIGEP